MNIFNLIVVQISNDFMGAMALLFSARDLEFFLSQKVEADAGQEVLIACCSICSHLITLLFIHPHSHMLKSTNKFQKLYYIREYVQSCKP